VNVILTFIFNRSNKACNSHIFLESSAVRTINLIDLVEGIQTSWRKNMFLT
jgi:hypothetical protein